MVSSPSLSLCWFWWWWCVFQKLFFLLLIPKIVRFFFGRDMHFFSLESNRPHFSFDSGTVRAFVRPLVESKVNLLSLFFLTGGVPF